MKMARIGVLLDKQAVENRWRYGLNVFERYIGEILSHAGIPFEWVEETRQISHNVYDIVLVGAAVEDESAASVIWNYADKGGVVISFAGLNVLAKRLGFIKSNATGPGYAKLEAEGDNRPLRFLDAVPWIRIKDNEIPCREFGGISDRPEADEELRAALQQFHVGEGMINRWSVDIVNTIVCMQQGTKPVFEDGVPDPDGMGQVDEGILKADDQVEMNWKWDRLETDTGARYFAHPYADLWREVIIGHVLHQAVEKGKSLPIIGYWPEGVEGVAMISHDSDRNFDEDADTTLKMLDECGIRSTWCMMMPGYSAFVYPRIKAAGHELAFHFNGKTNEGGAWKKAEFERQFSWLQGAVGQTISSNKNHFTVFEGWGDLFEWCEASGIASDQTRGPSKRGNVGFPFGTCHPYFPIAWSNDRNRMYDVIEIGFLTQDIPLWTDLSVVAPFLDEVMKVKGAAHFLFHQAHIHRTEEVRDALRTVVDEAGKRGFVFWTGQQINDWERARRKLKISGFEPNGDNIINAEQNLEQAVVWRTVLKNEEIKQGEITEKHFGVLCKKVLWD